MCHVSPCFLRIYVPHTTLSSSHETFDPTLGLQRQGAGYTLPEWYGLQDPYPELGVVVSAMAAGPIASCDGVGDGNTSLLMRVARADGVLLKPSRPAVAIDEQWLGDLFCPGGSTAQNGSAPACGLCSRTGEISETFTDLLPGLR